ncbi:penicillin-binding protein [Nocardia sp. NBC_01503]|uniref:NTF2-like N-terminal transpeptidase domain-containing protein n=1 Tax=Nocardia sp. NBC_01503 TaxID=2975997 RepID=UPI002E7BABBA|nr:NTF2-like N-terminal transpeptidase domain-containing protein [Nocardia sp. NBC_01503]WTL34929.1 penicillin-binding protein [Nocardia sp. NBC_01503]
MDVWGSRRFRIRGAIVLAVVLAVAIAMGSCAFRERSTGAEAVVERFTSLLDKQDYDGAARLTSYPNGASATLKQVFSGLNPGKADYQMTQFIGLDGNTGLFSMTAAWNFGDKRDWKYDLQGTVRKLSVGWRISWDPALVIPQLDSKRNVKLVRTYAAPSPRVNDIVGAPLMTEQTINVVKLDPSKTGDPVGSSNALAAAIEPVAPLITGPVLLQQLSASQGKPIVAVNLREGDFEILEPRMAAIPGVVLEKQPRLISADRRVWSPLLDAMRKVWQDNNDQRAGWGVQLFEPDGAFVTQLAGEQGPPGPDIPGTMDQRLQRAAEDAVVSVGTPASIVAIQPSSGAVVAVAQNSQASEHGSVAFTGLYPVGGMIELFKNMAALTKKKAPQDVSVGDAADAASQLGVGLDFKVPGLDETTGRLPSGANAAEQVGRGNAADSLLASPWGMAIAAAAIANGQVPKPMITIGVPARTEADLPALPGDVIDRLRTMLRDGAAAPESASLNRYQGVQAYAATAGNNGWLIATMGDLAFAIHIDDVDSSDATARMAARLLQSLATPD